MIRRAVSYRNLFRSSSWSQDCPYSCLKHSSLPAIRLTHHRMHPISRCMYKYMRSVLIYGILWQQCPMRVVPALYKTLLCGNWLALHVYILSLKLHFCLLSQTSSEHRSPSQRAFKRVPFQEDTDNVRNFPNMKVFHAFKKQRYIYTEWWWLHWKSPVCIIRTP